MTEEEWLVCSDPDKMLRHIGQASNDRKLKLFACASCRRQWHLITDIRLRTAVEMTEGFVDGVISLDELKNAKEDVESLEAANDQILAWFETAVLKVTWTSSLFPDGRSPAFNAAICTPYEVAIAVAHLMCPDDDPDDDTDTRRERAWLAERAAQCPLLRDIFPSSSQHPWFDIKTSGIRTETTRSIAKHIYDNRAFDAMPVLADALQDAGCEMPAVFDHCRSPGPHVRGCWVVDLVLGKE